MKTAPRASLGRLPASAAWRLHSNHSADQSSTGLQGSTGLRDRVHVPGSFRRLPCRHISMIGRRAAAGNCIYRPPPEITWRACGRRGHDGRVTKPQDRPGSGPLSVSARSWLVRQACGEKVASCRRKQDSHAREVHEVVTASGGRLVIRGEAEDGLGLDQEAWFLGPGTRLRLAT